MRVRGVLLLTSPPASECWGLESIHVVHRMARIDDYGRLGCPTRSTASIRYTDARQRRRPGKPTVRRTWHGGLAGTSLALRMVRSESRLRKANFANITLGW